jgi:hypothetical protein
VAQGLAFPEWNEKHHKVRYEPPPSWAYFASVDWGYSDHCAVLFYAAGPKDLLVRSEIYVQKKIPYDVGYQLGQHAKRYPRLEYVVGGSDMWDVRDGGETIGEKFQAGLRDATMPNPLGLMSMPRGKGTRHAGKMSIHEFLKYEALPDGSIPAWSGARLRIHEDCKNLLRTLPAMPIDPKDSEDVLEGGEDHLYDSLRYGLSSRFPRPRRRTSSRAGGQASRLGSPAQAQETPVAGRAGRRGGTDRGDADRWRVLTGIRYGGARPEEDA